MKKVILTLTLSVITSVFTFAQNGGGRITIHTSDAQPRFDDYASLSEASITQRSYTESDPLCMACNEREGFIVVYHETLKERNIRLEVSDFVPLSGNGSALTPEVSRMQYIYTDYADILCPYGNSKESVNAKEGKDVSFYVELRTKKGCIPGKYKGIVTFYDGNTGETLGQTQGIYVKVWDFDLPEGHYCNTFFGNAYLRSFYSNYLSDYEAHEDKIRKGWADFLLDYGISGLLSSENLLKNDRITVAQYLSDPRVSSIFFPGPDADTPSFPSGYRYLKVRIKFEDGASAGNFCIFPKWYGPVINPQGQRELAYLAGANNFPAGNGYTDYYIDVNYWFDGGWNCIMLANLQNAGKVTINGIWMGKAIDSPSGDYLLTDFNGNGMMYSDLFHCMSFNEYNLFFSGGTWEVKDGTLVIEGNVGWAKFVSAEYVENMKVAYNFFSQHQTWLDKALFWGPEEQNSDATNRDRPVYEKYFAFLRELWPDNHTISPFYNLEDLGGGNFNYSGAEANFELCKEMNLTPCPLHLMYSNYGQWNNGRWLPSTSKSTGYDLITNYMKESDKKVWWYAETLGRGSESTPYLIRRNEAAPGLSNRSLFWQQYHAGIAGYLSVGLAYFDWLSVPQIWQEDYLKKITPWFLVFPAKPGEDPTVPYPTLRLKQLVNGLNDFDYLKLAEEFLGKKFVDDIFKEVFAFEKFPDNPGAFIFIDVYMKDGPMGTTNYYENARKKIGEALEKFNTEQHWHNWGEWEAYIEPTDAYEGYALRTCKICGTQESKTLSHDDIHIDETVVDNSISIYPNPTNYEVKVMGYEGKIKKIEIIDLSGRTLMSLLYPSSPINVANLSQGIYFVRIETDKGIVTKKIVKK